MSGINRTDYPQVEEKLTSLRTVLRSLLVDAQRESIGVEVDPLTGIDFYEAVAKYEIKLIETALLISGGQQRRLPRSSTLRPAHYA